MKKSAYLTVFVILMVVMPNISLAAVIAESGFSSGDEGWKVVSTEGYYGAPDWSSTGGNPGGYIYDTDMDNGGWGFLAPQKFLGDVSAVYGNKLTFDFLANRIGAGNDFISVALAKPDGVGIITYVPAPSAVNVINHREISLDDSREWYVFDYTNSQQSGPAAAVDIIATLSDLGYLFLGAELCPGYDTDGTYEYGELVAYDNVILVPEPGMVLLVGLGWVMLRRRKVC